MYLLIRHENIFFSLGISFYLLIIGTLTIIMASCAALYETDLKKIVALSTLRQLGVIVLALGLGAVGARFFHLISHAFFKALLFLTTGSFIHSSNNYQDLRVIGGAVFSLPISRGFCLISIFSLIGIPFISAFFSKELILETILLNNFNIINYFLILSGVFLTAFYSTRFLILGLAKNSCNEQAIFKSDKDYLLTIRMIILFLPAIIGGWGLS